MGIAETEIAEEAEPLLVEPQEAEPQEAEPADDASDWGEEEARSDGPGAGALVGPKADIATE